MGKNPSFSGNIELLKSISEVQKSTYTLNAGNNIELDYDANTQTNTINVLATPNFDDLVVNNVNVLNELNKKYSVVNDVTFADNEINLNLGFINGVQTPKLDHQAVNKKYVDEQLDYFWDQILKMNFVNFKGRYNDRLTYGNGDLVAHYENNNWYFYLSIIDLNNEPLNSTKGWIKISTPVPSNLVTTDVLQLEIDKLNQRIDGIEKKIEFADIDFLYKNSLNPPNWLESRIRWNNPKDFLSVSLSIRKMTDASKDFFVVKTLTKNTPEEELLILNNVNDRWVNDNDVVVTLRLNFNKFTGTPFHTTHYITFNRTNNSFTWEKIILPWKEVI